jgi:hypothetical protein
MLAFACAVDLKDLEGKQHRVHNAASSVLMRSRKHSYTPPADRDVEVEIGTDGILSGSKPSLNLMRSAARIREEAAALAPSYAPYMGPGREYCDDGVLSESSSSGQSDCEQRCSDSADCKYISLWSTGDVNWCRLTTGCARTSEQAQHKINVYAKPEEDAPYQAPPPRKTSTNDESHAGVGRYIDDNVEDPEEVDFEVCKDSGESGPFAIKDDIECMKAATKLNLKYDGVQGEHPQECFRKPDSRVEFGSPKSHHARLCYQDAVDEEDQKLDDVKAKLRTTTVYLKEVNLEEVNLNRRGYASRQWDQFSNGRGYAQYTVNPEEGDDCPEGYRAIGLHGFKQEKRCDAAKGLQDWYEHANCAGEEECTSPHYAMGCIVTGRDKKKLVSYNYAKVIDVKKAGLRTDFKRRGRRVCVRSFKTSSLQKCANELDRCECSGQLYFGAAGKPGKPLEGRYKVAETSETHVCERANFFDDSDPASESKEPMACYCRRNMKAVSQEAIQYCDQGIRAIEKRNVCCPKSCVECGGDNCGKRPGGKDMCCVQEIRAKGNICSSQTETACNLPITPQACADDTSWHKKGSPSKNCQWVSELLPKRCDVLGDKKTAKEACKKSCDSCESELPAKADNKACADDASWHKKGDTAKNCQWVSKLLPKRCDVLGDKKTAKEACKNSCDSCESELPAKADKGSTAEEPSAAPSDKKEADEESNDDTDEEADEEADEESNDDTEEEASPSPPAHDDTEEETRPRPRPAAEEEKHQEEKVLKKRQKEISEEARKGAEEFRKKNPQFFPRPRPRPRPREEGGTSKSAAPEQEAKEEARKGDEDAEDDEDVAPEQESKGTAAAGCKDDERWAKVGDGSKDCEWVAQHARRCDVWGRISGQDERIKAAAACECACS